MMVMSVSVSYQVWFTDDEACLPVGDNAAERRRPEKTLWAQVWWRCSPTQGDREFIDQATGI